MGGHGSSGERRAWAGISPPCGPGRSPRSPPWDIPLDMALLDLRARIDLILLKVSQNDGVSPERSKRPVIVPIYQNGSQKSPLEILRFTYSSAFSHKELMGLFWPYGYIIVKMTKCRPDVHTQIGVAKGSQIPPRSAAASCLLRPAPHLLSAVFSSHPVSIRKLGTFWPQEG